MKIYMTYCFTFYSSSMSKPFSYLHVKHHKDDCLIIIYIRTRYCYYTYIWVMWNNNMGLRTYYTAKYSMAMKIAFMHTYMCYVTPIWCLWLLFTLCTVIVGFTMPHDLTMPFLDISMFISRDICVHKVYNL